MHEPSIPDEGLPVLTKEVGNYSSPLKFVDGRINNKCVDMRNVHVLVDESCRPSWAELCDEFGDQQEHELRRD